MTAIKPLPELPPEALTDFVRCDAYCLEHQRSCNVTTGVHTTDAHDNPLHVCGGGPRYGHNFYSREATT